jgi:membrane protease YdiL (CAAX protease family)
MKNTTYAALLTLVCLTFHVAFTILIGSALLPFGVSEKIQDIIVPVMLVSIDLVLYNKYYRLFAPLAPVFDTQIVVLKSFAISCSLGFLSISIFLLVQNASQYDSVQVYYATKAWSALQLMRIVAVAMIEELIFRGLLMGIVRSNFGAVSAILIQSIIFALVHFSNGLMIPEKFIQLISMGVFCGALVVFYKNIFVAATYHCFMNLFATSLSDNGLATKSIGGRGVASGFDVYLGVGDSMPKMLVIQSAVHLVFAAILMIVWMVLRRRESTRAVAPSISLTPGREIR